MDGRRVVIASFATPVEAEVARGLLAASGIDAFLRDDLTVGVAPHLSVLMGGVRLEVFEGDAGRANDVLESAEPEQVADEPVVYRVTRNRAQVFGLLGGGLGLGAAVLAGVPEASTPLAVVLIAGGALVGLVWGSSLRTECCSNVTCQVRLEPEHRVCPGCGRRVLSDDEA